jgi:hypothetical protein
MQLNFDHLRRLMVGEHADLVFADPPYNVDHEGYTDEKLKMKGDRIKPAEFDRFYPRTSALTSLSRRPMGVLPMRRRPQIDK